MHTGASSYLQTPGAIVSVGELLLTSALMSTTMVPIPSPRPPRSGWYREEGGPRTSVPRGVPSTCRGDQFSWADHCPSLLQASQDKVGARYTHDPKQGAH